MAHLQVIGIYITGVIDNRIIMPMQQLYALHGANTSIVAAAVILLAMFLVMRQRVREIGILKAIGAQTARSD